MVSAVSHGSYVMKEFGCEVKVELKGDTTALQINVSKLVPAKLHHLETQEMFVVLVARLKLVHVKEVNN